MSFCEQTFKHFDVFCSLLLFASLVNRKEEGATQRKHGDCGFYQKGATHSSETNDVCAGLCEGFSLGFMVNTARHTSIYCRLAAAHL